MRIALITDRFGKGRGGAELYLRELAKDLASHGEEPMLFSMDRPESFPAKTVFVDPGPLPRGWRERRYSSLVLEEAKRASCDVTLGIRPFPGIDCFQPHGGAMEEAWRGRAQAKEGMRRALWKAGHLFDVKFRILRELEKETIRRARKILPVSEASARGFRSMPFCDTAKVEAVPLGVDFLRFSPQGEQAPPSEAGFFRDAPFALFAAHDFELKGLATVFAAIFRLRAEGLSLRVAVLGEDRSMPRWRERTAVLGISDQVHFLGAVSDSAPWYRAASVLLHPTFFDPCARVTLEALACGLPVVTTQRNGAWKPGMPGVVAIEDPRDAGALADACRRVLALPKAGENFGFLDAGYDARSHFQRLREILRASGKQKAGASFPLS